jgi:alkaline phosphatase D
VSICRTFLGSILAVLLVAHAATALASDKVISRIAFGSCAKQQLPQPIWNSIEGSRPDIFLFFGDAIYGDWNGAKVFMPTPETLKRDWDMLAAKPEFQEFRVKVPILGVVRAKF